MITDYFVCYGASTEELHNNVKISIEKGWQPFGGVSVALSVKWLTGEYSTVEEDRRELYCQTVVKTTDSD